MAYPTFTSGQTLTAAGLQAAFQLGWGAGAVGAVGAGLSINGGTIEATGTAASEWQAGTVTTLGGGLSLSTGTLSATAAAPEWTAGTVIAVGAGLSISSQTLTASVTAAVGTVVAGSGLVGGTITSSGTISLDAIAAGELFGNAGTVTAVPAGIAIGTGLSLSTAGTLSSTISPGITQLVAGTGLSGGTITGTGTVALQTIAADTLLGNVGTVSAIPSGVPIGTGLTVTGGTLDALWNAGTVAAVGAGLAIGSDTLNAAWNGGTVTALGAGQTLAAGTLAARTSARMQIEWASGAIVQNDTVWFVYDPPYAGTINTLKYFTGAGTFTAAVQIDGTVVTGLSAVTVNSATPGTATATGANTFTAGQPIAAIVTGATGSPADALLSLDVTWST